MINLTNAKYIGVDCETCDPLLLERGPGDIRRDGFVVCVSLSGYDNAMQAIGKTVISLRDRGDVVADYGQKINYLRDVLGDEKSIKIGANIQYDLGWLKAEGIDVLGPLRCVQINEALIYELYQSYTLDSIAKRRFGKGKDETRLMEFGQRYGYKANEVKKNLWRFPKEEIEDYALEDADLVCRIYFEQYPELIALGLEEVFLLESELIRVLFKMRQRGIPISLENCEKALEKIKWLSLDASNRVESLLGPIDIWSNKSIGEALDDVGISYPRTAKGNPSITKEWLEGSEHDAVKAIRAMRQLDRGGNVFITDKIVGMAVNGRVHPNYSQTRRDVASGTRSGRLSSDNPNIQQIPARDTLMAPLVRSCFVPDAGNVFGVADYSQQEPRITVHYAALTKAPGWEVACDYFRNGGDYHTMAQEFMSNAAGREINRTMAKGINLGYAYGMGAALMSNKLGVTLSEGKEILNLYRKAMPWVPYLTDQVSGAASRRGYVKTLLGRRANFVGGTGIFAALNRIVQGSAADQMKRALIALDKAGYLPYATVHDEVDLPIEIGKEAKQIKEISEIMNEALPLVIPMKVGFKLGPSWGEVKEIE